jgi:hypothetical protein
MFSKFFYFVENNNKYQLSEKYSKLWKFIRCFPSIKGLSYYIKKIDFTKTSNKKEILFIRLIIEMDNHFYKKFDYPLYKV